jgi:hypothetical protein
MPLLGVAQIWHIGSMIAECLFNLLPEIDRSEKASGVERFCRTSTLHLLEGTCKA